MAQCVTWQNGVLVATTDSPDTCQGYLLMQTNEYATAMTLGAAFQMPTADQIGTAWAAGFCLPVLCYVIARGCRSIFQVFGG
ncbi:hypothetical protein R38712_03935 [Ralstonia pickettii]|uniref:Uncharacterized protein n=1 Tax=Ralstonia pickettii TaxID=329 RepID=A0ABN9I9T0_RALPI|nr:hypothetical protein R38712_03935 [Ralstonia pickettii]